MKVHWSLTSENIDTSASTFFAELTWLALYESSQITETIILISEVTKPTNHQNIIPSSNYIRISQRNHSISICFGFWLLVWFGFLICSKEKLTAKLTYLGIINILQFSVSKSYSALLQILQHEKGFWQCSRAAERVPE